MTNIKSRIENINLILMHPWRERERERERERVINEREVMERY